MSKVLVIGAGGVASVAVHKMAQLPEIFSGVTLASRRRFKCDAVAVSVKERFGYDVETAEVDADDVDATAALIERVQPKLVVNLALPYQDLSIMEACLRTGTDYLDTANYEPRDEAKFEYKWQWDLHDRFKGAGLMALLGSGFDPGVTSVFASYIKKHLLDRIDTLDILDCNGGDHGQHFATNFNPEINIREVTAPARHYDDGRWIETPALSTKQTFDFDQVGEKNMYLMYHEELESLARHLPEIRRIRFWMTFGDAYLKHLEVLQNVGMTRIDPVLYEGREIIPLQFLKAVLPEPASLGETTKGKTNIGDIATGTRDGQEKTVYVYNICDHEDAYRETGNQAVSYTTGVPAMIGAAMMLTGQWRGEGVFNMEQFDPDPFMAMLSAHGLPWQVKELAGAAAILTMATKAGGPGAFADFDLSRVPSPCFVVDRAAIEANLQVLADVGERGGAKVLLALKAFSMWSLGDLVSEHLDGVATSGLWEAKLGRAHFKGEVATFCAGYKASDFPEVAELSDHLIFNSPSQVRRFRSLIGSARCDLGLRLNPMHSEGEVAKYDPAQPHSRLGHPADQLKPEDLDGIDGIHVHSLCEQDFPPLRRTWEALRPRLEPYFEQLKWLNFGGGHHITRADYQRDDLVDFLNEVRAETGLDLYLEPGEAVALDAGILVGEVLDVIDNGMPVAILDISATCHMPDVIEAPYRPALLGEPDEGVTVRLGGPSCLAGDIIGDYRFARLPRPGDRLAFLDQAHYSMVKTTTFNGVPLPAIALWERSDGSIEVVREFGYADFEGRLS